jgi:hypothetical protein
MWPYYLVLVMELSLRTATALSLAVGTLAITIAARRRDWIWLGVCSLALLAAVYGPLVTPWLYPMLSADSQNPHSLGAILLLVIDTGWLAWPAVAALVLSLRPQHRTLLPGLRYSSMTDPDESVLPPARVNRDE